MHAGVSGADEEVRKYMWTYMFYEVVVVQIVFLCALCVGRASLAGPVSQTRVLGEGHGGGGGERREEVDERRERKDEPCP